MYLKIDINAMSSTNGVTLEKNVLKENRVDNKKTPPKKILNSLASHLNKKNTSKIISIENLNILSVDKPPNL